MSDANLPPDPAPGEDAGSRSPPYGQAYGDGAPPAATQLPYGAVGAGQAPPGPHPYGGPGQYGGPYIPPIPKQGGSGRIVLIVLLVVLLVTCGGCLAVGGVMVSAGRDMVRELEDYDYDPGTTAQATVQPGAAFELGDLSFDEGWAVVVDGPVASVEGLVATSTSGTDSVALNMTFFKAERELGTATCGGSSGAAGEAITLACVVTDKKVRRADRVVVDSLL